MAQESMAFEAEIRRSILKKRPRGRPWPKGVSGNPQGRPRGARNQFTRAILEGSRRAEEKLAQPKVGDRERPYECWGGYLIQKGLLFACDPILKDYVALPGQDPTPTPPARRAGEKWAEGAEKSTFSRAGPSTPGPGAG